MDELGYYCLWTAEHHFQREGYEVFPNLILLGTWLATQTRQLKFGCAFNVLPMWHPMRLAEDYAMADILTGGRVILGVGRGYHTREVETFGAPMLDNEANQELFEEQMEVLLKAFNEEALTHQARTTRSRRRSSTAAISSRTSRWCRGPSIARSRSGSPSPAARPFRTSPSAASRAWSP